MPVEVAEVAPPQDFRGAIGPTAIHAVNFIGGFLRPVLADAVFALTGRLHRQAAQLLLLLATSRRAVEIRVANVAAGLLQLRSHFAIGGVRQCPRIGAVALGQPGTEELGKHQVEPRLVLVLGQQGHLRRVVEVVPAPQARVLDGLQQARDLTRRNCHARPVERTGKAHEMLYQRTAGRRAARFERQDIAR